VQKEDFEKEEIFEQKVNVEVEQDKKAGLKNLKNEYENKSLDENIEDAEEPNEEKYDPKDLMVNINKI